MLIALKYCGGCNPRYDRGNLTKQLETDFPEADIVTAGNLGGRTPDVVAVITGCASACADHEQLQGRLGKVVLCEPGDYEALSGLVASGR